MKKTYITTLAIGSVFSSFATIHTVVNSGFTFSPSSLTIESGDTVQFTIGSAHEVREVDQTTWDANGNTALSGGFSTPLGGGMILPAALTVGTHYYVCVPHASMGMKGTITVNPSSLNTRKEEPLEFSVYPNPSHNTLNLNIQSQSPGANYQVSLLDITGNSVADFSFTSAQNQIDLQGISPGIYFVRVKVNEAILTKRICVQ